MNESLTSPNIPASRKLKQEDFQRFLNNSLNYDKESPEKGEAKRSRKDLILNRRSDPTDQAKTEVSERQLFDDRLKTFQPLLWTASNPVTPLECARYGWKLVAADLLKCVTCEAVVYGKLPSPSNPAVYADGAEKLRAKLVSSHAKFCKWPTLPCPEDFYDLNIGDNLASKLTKEVVELISSPLSTYLPRFTDRTKFNFVAPNLLKQFVTMVLETKSDLNEEDVRSAVILQVVGWSLTGTTHVPLIACDKCNRKCGAWMFQANSDPQMSESSELFPDPCENLVSETVEEVLGQDVTKLVQESMDECQKEEQDAMEKRKMLQNEEAKEKSSLPGSQNESTECLTDQTDNEPFHTPSISQTDTSINTLAVTSSSDLVEKGAECSPHQNVDSQDRSPTLAPVAGIASSFSLDTQSSSLSGLGFLSKTESEGNLSILDVSGEQTSTSDNIAKSSETPIQSSTSQDSQPTSEKTNDDDDLNEDSEEIYSEDEDQELGESGSEDIEEENEEEEYDSDDHSMTNEQAPSQDSDSDIVEIVSSDEEERDKNQSDNDSDKVDHSDTDVVPSLDGQFDLDRVQVAKPYFHPLDNHQMWCPWIRRTRTEPDLPGWASLVLKLRSELPLAQTTPTRATEHLPIQSVLPMERLEKVRSILNS